MSFSMVKRKMLTALAFQTNPQDVKMHSENDGKWKCTWKECWQNVCLWVKDANGVQEKLQVKKQRIPFPPALPEYFFQGFESCRMTWKGVIKPC